MKSISNHENYLLHFTMPIRLGRMVFVFLFISCWQQTFAQFGTTSSGGEAKDNLSSVSFSIGQMFFVPSNEGLITPGLQQSYKLVPMIKLDNSISVYPNPSTGNVILKISNNDYTNYRFEIYDLSGKLLMSDDAQNIETTIALMGLANTVYICKIFRNNNEVNIFKIIKI